MRVHLDTDAFPERRRAATWRDILRDTYFSVECDVGDKAFRGVVDGHRVGDHSITRDTTSGHAVERPRSLIKHDRIERISFAFVLAGRAVLMQSGREAVVEPGMVAFNDSGRPFETWSGERSDIIWLSVPRQSLADRIRGLDDLTATAFAPSRPLGAIASDLLAGLDALDGPPNLPSNEADTLVVQTLDLLALAAMSSTVRSTWRDVLPGTGGTGLAARPSGGR